MARQPHYEYPQHYVMKKNRIVRFRQANGICETCQNPAQVIHHKDRTKTNHELTNLAVLCYMCHGLIHRGQTRGKYRPRGTKVRKESFRLEDYYMDILRSEDKKHYWSRIRAKNRKILWASETLTSKQNAMKPIIDLVRYIGKSKCQVMYYANANDQQTSEVI